MRLLSIALLTALAFPLAAIAQTVKQVEVTNLPAVQDVDGTVEVTNDAANPVPVAVTNLPAVQDVNIFTICLQLPDYSHDSTEAAGITVLNRTDTIGVVQVYEGQTRCFLS